MDEDASSLNIKALVASALELDSLGRGKEAHEKYYESLAALLAAIQEPSKSFSHLQLAQNCLERMKTLAERGGWLDEKDGETDDYLQFASQPSSRRSSKDEKQSVGGGRESALSRLSVQTKEEGPRRSLTGGGSVDSSLSAMRKRHENELVARQREKTQLLLRAQAGTLARNEEYVSDLLGRRRQRLYASVNDKLTEIFGNISARINDIKGAFETESRRRAIRAAVGDQLRREADFAVVEPIVELLHSRTSPIAIVLRTFISRCQQLLQQAGAAQTSPKAATETVMREAGLVERQLVGILQDSFEEVRDPCLEVSLKVSFQQYIFSTALSASLLGQLRRQNAGLDSEIAAKFAALGWEELFARLKIKGKWQLPRDRALDEFPIQDPGIYGRAVEELRSISLAVTPLAKLLCLTRCCSSICQAVDEFRREGATPLDGGDASVSSVSEESSSLGSEDLLLLSAYVLVRSHVPDLASQLMFISELVPEELVRGEAGYVLATMQTSLDYILTLPV